MVRIECELGLAAWKRLLKRRLRPNRRQLLPAGARFKRGNVPKPLSTRCLNRGVTPDDRHTRYNRPTTLVGRKPRG